MAYTIGNAMVYTGDEFIKEGYVSFEDRVISTGKMDDLKSKIDRDAHGMLVMPAWINAHTHVYSTLARGMSLQFNPMSFTQILEQLWWKLDRKLGQAEIESSAYVAAAEFIHAGVSTIFDHHSSQNFVKGALPILKRSIVDVAGMRGIFCHETSDRDGTQIESIEENVDFFKSNHNEKSAGMMGLHASFTLGDRTLREVSKACDGQIPIHIHVAEGIEDELYSINDHGMRIIPRLESYGLTIPNSIYAHCIHIDESEANLISKNKGYVANTTQSNMNNGVGVADLEMIRSNGAKVVMGNDGFGFSPVFDLRSTVLGQKNLYKSPTAFSTFDLKSIIENTFELASNHLKVKFGKIKSGYAADLVMIEYDPPTPIDEKNFWDHLFFGITESRVNSLYVAGKPLMIDNEIKVFDEVEVRKASRKVAETLWKNL
ncbi:amidohydrolase family protein [Athalassotoga sp.]|uniref:amidohydrolase family protein n=1 Tax=Athalassotoga sp. TaxID=2022597 RepID=UPI003CFFD6E9